MRSVEEEMNEAGSKRQILFLPQLLENELEQVCDREIYHHPKQGEILCRGERAIAQSPLDPCMLVAIIACYNVTEQMIIPIFKAIKMQRYRMNCAIRDFEC